MTKNREMIAKGARKEKRGRKTKKGGLEIGKGAGKKAERGCRRSENGRGRIRQLRKRRDGMSVRVSESVRGASMCLYASVHACGVAGTCVHLLCKPLRVRECAGLSV